MSDDRKMMVVEIRGNKAAEAYGIFAHVLTGGPFSPTPVYRVAPELLVRCPHVRAELEALGWTPPPGGKVVEFSGEATVKVATER